MNPRANPIRIAFRSPKGSCGAVAFAGDVDIFLSREKICLAAIHIKPMVWPIRVELPKLCLCYHGGLGLIAAISGDRMTSLANAAVAIRRSERLVNITCP